MQIWDENGKLTPKHLEVRWDLIIKIQVEARKELLSAILALTATDGAPDKILEKLEEMKMLVELYKDLKALEAEQAPKQK